MDREDIIRIAREAGYISWQFTSLTTLESFAALVAEHERQRIITKNAPEIEKINAHIKTLAAEREKVTHWMLERGYATGHGESIEDLLKELEWQIEDRIKNIIRARGNT